MTKIINGQVIEMTAEEIAELERLAQELPPPEPTMDERVAALETTSDDLILMMADLIGGN